MATVEVFCAKTRGCLLGGHLSEFVPFSAPKHPEFFFRFLKWNLYLGINMIVKSNPFFVRTTLGKSSFYSC